MPHEPMQTGDGGFVVSSSEVPASVDTLFPPRPWGLGAVIAGIVTALAFLGLGLLVLAMAIGEDGDVSHLPST